MKSTIAWHKVNETISYFFLFLSSTWVLMYLTDVLFCVPILSRCLSKEIQCSIKQQKKDANMKEGKRERKRGNLRLWDDVIDVFISLFPFHLTGYINPHASVVIIAYPFICSSMNKSSHPSANPLASSSI